ncbi:unnamed protein product [Lampetra fluviatilis]
MIQLALAIRVGKASGSTPRSVQPRVKGEAGEAGEEAHQPDADVLHQESFSANRFMRSAAINVKDASCGGVGGWMEAARRQRRPSSAGAHEESRMRSGAASRSGGAVGDEGGWRHGDEDVEEEGGRGSRRLPGEMLPFDVAGWQAT